MELQQFADEVTDGSGLLWCTSGQPRETETISFPYIPAKSLSRAVSAVPLARRILRAHNVRRVLTTGAAIALPFAVACRIERIPIHYVESAARQDRLSVTGRLLRASHLAVVAAQFDMGRGIPVSSNVFDGFHFDSAVSRVPVDGPLRVVVTFGTSSDWTFRAAIDKVAGVLSGVVEDSAEILWQTGVDGEVVMGQKTHRLVPVEDLRDAMARAHLIIGHAGVGTALMALQAGRVPVLLPRRAGRGEHTDDHQVQLASFLKARDLAVTCEVDELTADHLRTAIGRRVRRVGEEGPTGP